MVQFKKWFYLRGLPLNILINKTLRITKSILEYKNIEIKLRQEIITLLHTILNQNYFKFANTFYKPEKGVAMGFLPWV
jgi:hypothetical protein